MTDISSLIGRLLPFAVITSLALIFYLLDVYSVGSGFDAESAKVAARRATAAETRATAVPQVERFEWAPAPAPSAVSDVSSPASPGPAPADSTSNFQPESELPAEGEAPEPLAPPAASMGQQDELNSTGPSYAPPAGSPGQPLASDMNTTAPIRLPNDEITQDDSEVIENESLQALDEAEQAVSQPGAVEQEQ